MNILKVSFSTNNPADTLQQINGFNYAGGLTWYPSLPIPLTSIFWIENNINGIPRLCMGMVDANPSGPNYIVGQFIDSTTMTSYTVNAKPFSAVQVGNNIEFKPE